MEVWFLIKSKVNFRGREIDLEPNDLAVDDLSSDNIRKIIAKAPAQFAFYSSMAAEVDHALRQLTHIKDSRTRELYDNLDPPPKATETWKKNAVQNADRKFFADMVVKMSQLETLKSKLRALSIAFDLQVKALQTVGGLIRTEVEEIMHSETNSMEE